MVVRAFGWRQARPRPLMRSPVFLLMYLTVSLTAAPVFDWAASGGGVKADKVRGLNVDRDGNVFVAGECADEVGFGCGRREEVRLQRGRRGGIGGSVRGGGGLAAGETDEREAEEGRHGEGG